MNQDEKKYIEGLLPRYCEGTLSREEEETVRTWMMLSVENRRIVKQIHTLNLAADTKILRRKVDIEGALEKVSARIDPPAKRKERLFVWMQRIAATLFLPLLIAYGIQYMKTDIVPSDMIEVKTNPGMTTSIILPDGSSACLNSGTTLTYPSRFTGATREISVDGEAFFMVEKDTEKKFIVNTPHQSRIEVLGTHFNVEAYKNENYISTTLIEGAIRFHYREGGLQKNINLSPGHKLVNNVAEENIVIVGTSGKSEIAWKDGKIILLNTPMNEALRMLEKRYNVEFIISDETLLTDSFTGTFTDQRLEQILEFFKVSSKINWRYPDSGNMNNEKVRIEIY